MPDTTPLSALEDMRSRHYRVDAPGLPGYPLQPGESMCGSDHHKWPCHAHILGGAVAAVLGLADRWDAAVADFRAHAGPAANAIVGAAVQEREDLARQVRAAITRELLGEDRDAGQD